MIHYSTGKATTTTTSTDYESDVPVVYSTEYETANNNKKSNDDDQLYENGYFPTPDFF